MWKGTGTQLQTIKMMKKIILILALIPFICTCKKGDDSKEALPDHLISFKVATVDNEQLSVYYIDSISNQKTIVKVRPWIVGDFSNSGYSTEMSTGNFTSKYLFEACSKGIKNFTVQFKKNNILENHKLFINFKYLSQPGGFEIDDANVDNTSLTKLPPSDSSKTGHYDTGFIYNR
jgi:hypothetical protein